MHCTGPLGVSTLIMQPDDGSGDELRSDKELTETFLRSAMLSASPLDMPVALLQCGLAGSIFLTSA